MRADTGNYWMEVELKSGEGCKHVLSILCKKIQAFNLRMEGPTDHALAGDRVV